MGRRYFNGAAAVGTFDAAYWSGYNTADIVWSSVTWTGVHNALTLTDVLQQGISRSNSDWTFAVAGKYMIDARFNVQGATSYAVGFRLRDVAGTTTHASGNVSLAPSTVAQCVIREPFTVTAGQVLQLQYSKSATGTAPTLAAITIDSEVMRNVEITFERVA
jgi:hypothetical protein